MNCTASGQLVLLSVCFQFHLTLDLENSSQKSSTNRCTMKEPSRRQGVALISKNVNQDIIEPQNVDDAIQQKILKHVLVGKKIRRNQHTKKTQASTKRVHVLAACAYCGLWGACCPVPAAIGELCHCQHASHFRVYCVYSNVASPLPTQVMHLMVDMMSCNFEGAYPPHLLYEPRVAPNA